MSAGLLACITTPKQGNRVPENSLWCADNGCFGKGYPGDAEWWNWLQRKPDRGRCLFAVAPDVVGDAKATLERSLPWLGRIRSLGIPAAFVSQDGLHELDIPWDEFDVLFVGGTTEWKLGPESAAIVAEAKARGKTVHMGRVNSYKRMKYAADIGCDSSDGTHIAFQPDVALPRVLGWLDRVNERSE